MYEAILVLFTFYFAEFTISLLLSDISFSMIPSRLAVPKHFGTRDQFHGRQFFNELGEELVQAALQVMGNDGE